jgi:hypothetical protein
MKECQPLSCDIQGKTEVKEDNIQMVLTDIVVNVNRTELVFNGRFWYLWCSSLRFYNENFCESNFQYRFIL